MQSAFPSRRQGLAIALALPLAAAARAAFAQSAAPADSADTLPVLEVRSRDDLLGTAETAGQGSVTREEMALRPVYRVGEILETVPGLAVTMHSGEGKANQFFFRGFALDHGTDFATFVDDMPVNEPTHAHGQGYTDLHLLIPQAVEGLDYTKGPFSAQIGDFGGLGSAHVRLRDEMPNQVTVSAGTLGQQTLTMTGTLHFNNGGRLAGAASIGHLDGPWSHADDFRSYTGLLRYSRGDRTDGFDITAMGYRGTSNFTTDQPYAAYQQGLIGRFGTLDPSDGSYAERASLSGHYDRGGDRWTLTASAYVIHSRLTLWNDFTHYLVDPVNGDQAQQTENRNTFGGQVVYHRNDQLSGLGLETAFGLMGRYDDAYVDRRHTRQRVTLEDCPDSPFGGGAFVCNADRVKLGNIGGWASLTTHWRPWLRTVTALRVDSDAGTDHSLVTGFRGSASQVLVQPKGSLILGPWHETELYVSAGRGFHSNDLRGVLGTVPGLADAGHATPLMTRITGEEVGLRSNILPRTALTLAVFREDIDSYQSYDADAGVNSAGPPARLEGLELSAQLHPAEWLELNADVNFTHSRYHTSTPAAYDIAGLYIPGAPTFIGSFGAIWDRHGPWFGGLQFRWLGPYPLVEDNSLRAPGYKILNLDVGYRFSPHLSAKVSIFNMFDTNAMAIEYAYAYRVSPGAAAGFGRTFHPVEPVSALFTLTGTF